MFKTLFTTLVFIGFAGVVNAQDGPFRIIGASEDGVFAVDENSIRTNDQGFRAFKFAAVGAEAEPVDVDGREVMSSAGTGEATIDCATGQIRLARLDILDANFAVVGTKTSEGFEDNNMSSITRAVCHSSPADLRATEGFPNIRSISQVARRYLGAASHTQPQMLWFSVSRQGDQASCLNAAHAAITSLGYEARTPADDWVGLYGAHRTLPIGALVRCDGPGEFLVFLSQPSYSVGDIDPEAERIKGALVGY